MIQIQKSKVAELYDAYLANIKQYEIFGSKDYCMFSVYENKVMPSDPFITVEWTMIDGLNDYNLPYTRTSTLVIDEDGNIYDTQAMNEVFKTESDIAKYVRRLTKISWDEK